MQPKELSQEEMQNVNGGGLLNGNDSKLQVGIQIGITISNTDEDGNTESRTLGIGLGNTTSTND